MARSAPPSQPTNPLFPTHSSFFIFVSYMALFINQGILVTASQDSKKSYRYNTITAVLLTELIKLVISCVMYSQQDSFFAYVMEIKKNWRAFGFYFPTAFLYCLYNNLSYTNLATFDPTTYFLLLQLRVGVTGIVFQILFKQKLSSYQWFSLVLLMLGCMMKEVNFTNWRSSEFSWSLEPSTGLLLILLQVCCSSSAGVYNEYLLKKQTQIPIFFQNSCLYVDSVLCNLLFLACEGNLSSGLDLESLQRIIFTPINLCVVVNNAAIGIVTSFFLFRLNSILKAFASALELLFTAVLSYFIFRISINLNTLLSIVVVSFAVWLYSKQPVDNRKSLVGQEEEEEDPELEKFIRQV